jgi:hypothetical protein
VFLTFSGATADVPVLSYRVIRPLRPLTLSAWLSRRLDGSGGGCRGHEAVAGRLGR